MFSVLGTMKILFSRLFPVSIAPELVLRPLFYGRRRKSCDSRALITADSQNNPALQQPGPLVSHGGVSSQPALCGGGSHVLPCPPSRPGSEWLEMVSGTNGTFQPHKAASVRPPLPTEAPAADVRVPAQTRPEAEWAEVICFRFWPDPVGGPPVTRV